MKICCVCKKNPIVPDIRRCDYPYETQATMCSDCRHLARFGKKASIKSYINRDGYVALRQENGSFAFEHRIVMEKILGRPLYKGESVHHKDSNRANNAPENLELWVHCHPNGIRASNLLCPHCGKPYSNC